ncbi:MAG: DUF262 domain-containing protein [Bryobacterales bacterium]|nr:DUF262 domain-containing protein [Bryobacterales bacterium]MDE0294936.1 DUF262 domain-containing protein [Bryobacterales bacterium]
MREIDVRKTQFSVADFLSWQKDGTLNLKPVFQRRSVWKPGAKSYFIDTVVRGLPAPIIYLRQQINLNSQKTTREVVDGQQRLRTILAYISPSSLKDYNPSQDAFEIRGSHNADLAGLKFDSLPEHYRERILGYEFSTHVLPTSVEDRDVLEMFARLNATGEKLNPQELRNAEYFGELKTLMYELALEQLERWTDWKIFTDDQIARMKEVELTSDLAINMIEGLTGKTQARIGKFYKNHDGYFAYKNEFCKRFRNTMEQIEKLLGKEITDTVFSSEVYFFTLFVFLYDRLYGLGSKLTSTQEAHPLSAGLKKSILEVGKAFRDEKVPNAVLDAVRRASADLGRRRTRLDYLKRNA